jgi:excisionase family DNA binding protein
MPYMALDRKGEQQPHRRGPAETMQLGSAATALGVSASTVRRWVENRRLSAVRTSGGHRRLMRSEVERERERLKPGPVLRAPPAPQDPLVSIGAAILRRSAWIADISLRSVYLGEDHGWFGSSEGLEQLDRWLEQMGQSLCSGDFEHVSDASRALLRAARDAGVPLGERMALLDGVAQAARAAVGTDRPGSGEVRDWLRVGRILRGIAVAGA